MSKWEYRSWALAEQGCTTQYYDSQDAAEAAALQEADDSPGMQFGIYQCVALVEAKVAKARVRPWRGKKQEAAMTDRDGK